MPHERGVCFGSLRCGAPRTVEEVALWRLSMLRRLGPSPPWFILAGGLVLGTCFPISPQSLRILSTATFVSDVVSTLPPAVAISRAAAAIVDVLPVPGGSSTARKPYGGKDSARFNPSVCHRYRPSASSWRSWEPGGVCS